MTPLLLFHARISQQHTSIFSAFITCILKSNSCQTLCEPTVAPAPRPPHSVFPAVLSACYQLSLRNRQCVDLPFSFSGTLLLPVPPQSILLPSPCMTECASHPSGFQRPFHLIQTVRTWRPVSLAHLPSGTEHCYGPLLHIE